MKNTAQFSLSLQSPPINYHTTEPTFASGEKAKACDIIAAIRTLHRIEQEKRRATPEERDVLARFSGFGPVALSIFPDPVTHRYKEGWQDIGEELKSLLTPDAYASAKRTTFNAFYTSAVVIAAMHTALAKLGVPNNACVLEPGCGTGNFMSLAPEGMKFIGVELDSISGRLARALHPDADIRIESFADTRLPQIDAVIGNPPFADVKLEFGGQRLSLHDYFIAKSVDALKPGGILAVVTSHFSLDRQNAAAREALAEQADFVGAIRLPSDAFKREGTAVVTDIMFLRKRGPGEPANHFDPAWLETAPMDIDGLSVPINRYFHNHPENVLGTWSRKDTLYGEGFSVISNGNLAEQLLTAIARLPEYAPIGPAVQVFEPPAFVPSPPEKHISEGSFFVGDDRQIYQVIDGTSEPVVYGGTSLRADGTMVGKRLAALIGLRDRARRVLQSQNDGWPESDRNDARRELNWAYDSFVSRFGPINKTTLSETKDGSVVRRMPNIVKWREDPDGMLVMSLEEYDDVTGIATKAPIMRQDVVGKTSPITSVTSAQDGLLISLDQKGIVDLSHIAQLYGKSEETIIAELGDLIYLDPESKTWETADAYLSGNVRFKLKVAEAAGCERNAEALRHVQPEDVLPGDIDAQLGAPFIPVEDIRDFAVDLFRVEPSAINIGHLERDAVWSVEGNWDCERSVANTSEFGTTRITGLRLLDLALNMKSPTIYDTLPDDSKVVNQDETLGAREKQKVVKDRFRSWVFADADRTERLVRLYNDTYNNLRLRHFDGSHLKFSGMCQGIQLAQHQVDAVWRGMSGGNTLLAHCVGAGKTFEMAATAMKLKETGLAKKSLIVVPNHMLEQFSREFQQLYPNAHLLVAGKEDFTRDRRKFLTAKIASGDWDAIIVTHSSFERIGMSRDYQADFLRQQIAEYDQLLIETAANKSDKAQRNLIKTIEKQKVAREEKLKDLLAEDKKDDGLVFDELGVDHLFIDEAQYFKNLETPTKMDRVAGIQTGGSERAFDMYMKARYLDGKHPGHGVTFATGTPVSNSMVEMYTMQRYLDPAGLRSRGIEHFDAWAATFGEVVEAMEIAPDGKSLRPRSRFAKFVNLPELQQMFRSFADVQTAEMLNLPRPTLEGGKAQIIACPMSDEQKAMQDELVERYEAIRSSKIDPRLDNALKITTEGRKLALDGRLLCATANDFESSKVNALAEKVAEIWKRTAATRGTQMIFSDMGVNPTEWGFSVYDEVIRKLVEHGVPREQIVAVGDADSDAKKQALFEKVRQGSIRVLIGSTSKMGTGTNVQRRLVALHHLDAPWKPAEVEQREGRILRQGNSNSEVAIYRYVTEGSFDAYMWQTLETKARFISQVMTGQSAIRRAEDVAQESLSYAEVKAIASGNPAVLTLAEADAELQRLSILRKSHADEQYLSRKKLKELPDYIERLTTRLSGLKADATTASKDDRICVRGHCSHEEALARLASDLNRIPTKSERHQKYPLGNFHGLEFGLERSPFGGSDVYLEGKAYCREQLNRESQGPRAVINALTRLRDSYDAEIARTNKELTLARNQLSDYQQRHGIPFVHAAYADELAQLRDQLRNTLSGHAAENEPASRELAERIKALKATQTVEPIPTNVIKPSHANAALSPVTNDVPPVPVLVVEHDIPPVTNSESIESAKPIERRISDDLHGNGDDQDFRVRIAAESRPVFQRSLI